MKVLKIFGLVALGWPLAAAADAVRVKSPVFALDTVSDLNKTPPAMQEGTALSQNVSAVFAVDTGGLAFDYVSDTDGDGLPDWWEAHFGLDFETADALADADGDGLSNADEFRLGHSPARPDWMTGVGATLAAAGLSGVFVLDTDGPRGDRNGDGLPDWWGKLFFTTDGAPAEEDFDGDGHSNGEEFAARTNPADAADVLRMLGVERVAGSGVRIEWASRPGRRYRVLSQVVLNENGETAVEKVVKAAELVSATVIPIESSAAFLKVAIQEE